MQWRLIGFSYYIYPASHKKIPDPRNPSHVLSCGLFPHQQHIEITWTGLERVRFKLEAETVSRSVRGGGRVIGIKALKGQSTEQMT